MLTATLRNNFRGFGTFLKQTANCAFMGSVFFPLSNCSQEKESSNCILCLLLQTRKFQLLKTSKYFFCCYFSFFFFFWLSYFILVVRCDCLAKRRKNKYLLPWLQFSEDLETDQLQPVLITQQMNSFNSSSARDRQNITH